MISCNQNDDVKLFILNNDGYLSIRNTQRDFFNGMYVGTGPESGVFIPSLKNQAMTYCIPYLSCECATEMANVIDQALAIDGPVFVEIKAMRDQRMIPSVMSEKLPDGKMQSKSLHEMYPYLSKEDLDKELRLATRKE